MARLQISSIVAGFKPDSTDYSIQEMRGNWVSTAKRAPHCSAHTSQCWCSPSCSRSKGATTKPGTKAHARRAQSSKRYHFLTHHNVIAVCRPRPCARRILLLSGSLGIRSLFRRRTVPRGTFHRLSIDSIRFDPRGMVGYVR